MNVPARLFLAALLTAPAMAMASVLPDGGYEIELRRYTDVTGQHIPYAFGEGYLIVDQPRSQSTRTAVQIPAEPAANWQHVVYW